MSKRHAFDPEHPWANVSPFEKERLRVIELQMTDCITKKQYREDMRAIDVAEKKAAVR